MELAQHEKRCHPLAAAPVVEHHPLQCGSFQNRHVTNILVGNRQKGLRQPKACFLRIYGIAETSAQAACKAAPIAFKASGPNDAPSMRRRAPLTEPRCSYSYPASFEMVWW